MPKDAQSTHPPAPAPRRLSGGALVALWVGFGGWLAVGGWLVAGWLRSPSPPPAPPRPTARGAAQLLVAVRPPPPALPALALLHRGRSADLLLVAAQTVVELPGRGPGPLGGSLESLGPEGLAVAVANTLGIRVPAVAVADAATVGALVGALGGVVVDLPEAVVVEEGGLRRTLYPQGRQTLGGEAFVDVLTRAVPGQSELERVARQGAAWQGLFRRLARRDGGAALRAWVGQEGAELVRAVASDPSFAIFTLPVRRVGLSEAELYEVDRARLAVVTRVLADVRMAPRAARRVRLLVDADAAPAVAVGVARRLVESGYVVVLSGRASRPYDATRVVAAEDTEPLRAEARRILRILGRGRLGVARIPQSLVDVTIVIGRDWSGGQGPPPRPDW